MRRGREHSAREPSPLSCYHVCTCTQYHFSERQQLLHRFRPGVLASWHSGVLASLQTGETTSAASRPQQKMAEEPEPAPEPEPEAEPEAEAEPDSVNMASCKEAFEMQKKMGLGDVTPEMMAEFGTAFAGYFADSVKMELNPGSTPPGPTAEGDLGSLMGVVGPIWMGFVNTAIENTYEEVSEEVIKVTQTYSNHLLDDLGEIVAATSNDMVCTQTCTYTEGKITGWVQEYDADLMVASRAAVVVANTVTVEAVPVVLAGPTSGGSVEQASAYLKQANSEGLSLYDHLSEVLSRILAEKPEDALAQLEEISAQIKKTRFVAATHATTSPAAVTAEQVASKAAAVKAALFTPAKGAIDPASGCREVPEVNTACAPPAELPVLEAAELLEQAGVGLGKSESYRIALAMQKLSEDPAESLTSCRFWGKILGTSGDYLVAECTAGGDRVSTVPALTDEEKYDQKVILAEPAGVGANKYVYYVCPTLASGSTGSLWTKLDDVTPAQISAAAKIKKLFTGDLTAPVVTYPAFPGGTEAAYLRAQLTRITVGTAIAPGGFYEQVEPAEGEEEVENPPDADTVTKVADPSEEGTWDTDLEDPASWVHTGRPLLSQGRCSWYTIPKRPKEPVLDEDGNPVEEEEEEPEEGEEKAEFPYPDISTETMPGVPEDAEEPPTPWVVRKYTGVVAVRSVVWPGAMAVASVGRGKHGMEFANVYIGSGNSHEVKLVEGKAYAKPYQPDMPLPFEAEFEDETLAEVPDKTVAEEKEWEEQQEALAEQAADAEAGEEE
eukprot:SAG22_NODE_654_length_8129_cov_7.457410_2_plen_781_part_00